MFSVAANLRGGRGCGEYSLLQCDCVGGSLPRLRPLTMSRYFARRVTVGVTNANQHAELLRHRGRAMKAVVDALVAANIDLVACTHALKV